MNYRPPHEARDNKKLDSMIATLNAGKALPSVVVCGEVAFSGSHRLAAYDAAGLEPDVIEIDDEDVAHAMEHLGLDPMYDEIERFDEFEDALKTLGFIE